MTIRIDEELLKQIKALAEAEDRSVNKTVVQALKKYVQENK